MNATLLQQHLCSATGTTVSTQTVETGSSNAHRPMEEVAGHQPPPQTLQELERTLLEEWDRIPQLGINSLIDSMPGNHTLMKMIF
ncbi:hypothetical protein TNCV_739681 [Trichonephila clavipes]|nr:hypothetical protein TNCV_739681 [Trichonephila clavipes]